MATEKHRAVRQLFSVVERVETGPVRFGKDWPGVFVRGDNAAGYLGAIRAVQCGASPALLEGLASLLRSAIMKPVVGGGVGDGKR